MVHDTMNEIILETVVEDLNRVAIDAYDGSCPAMGAIS